MLFMQPVLVNDAHALDRTTPAEVRLAEPQAAEDQPTWTGWTGPTLAQSGMDSRSPFGPNAVDHNDLTPPGTAPHHPGDTVAPPAGPNAARPTDSSSNTRIPPAQAPGQTDAGPPGASGTTTATPATTPSTGTPATVPSTATPAPVTTPGAGSASGTTATPPASTTATPGTTGGTLPGGSSGASNTR